MGKPEQAGKSHSSPSHCKPCLTCRKGIAGRKKLKTNISMEKQTNEKQIYVISGRKYRATQTQVTNFFY